MPHGAQDVKAEVSYGACTQRAGRLRRAVLAEVSGGATPAKVIAAGHSLGGGLASLAGVWAALQWPAADVRVVTLGSPMVGNQAWVDVRAPAHLRAFLHCFVPSTVSAPRVLLLLSSQVRPACAVWLVPLLAAHW